MRFAAPSAHVSATHCPQLSFDSQVGTLVDVTIPHTASTVTVGFGSTLTDARSNHGCAASFAVDNVMVWVSSK